MSNEPPPPPQLSPDGKFYWDGQRWVPLPKSSEPTPQARMKGPAVTPAVITLAGGIGAIIGTFLPWVTATGPFGISFSKAGIEGDGKFVAGLALICAGIAAFTLLRRPASFGIGLLILLFGLAELGLVIWVGSNISSAIGSIPSGSSFSAALGAGVYLSGLGAIATAAGGLMAITAGAPQRDQVAASHHEPAGDGIDRGFPTRPE